MNGITLLIIILLLITYIYINNSINNSIDTFNIGGYKCNNRDIYLTKDVELICNKNFLIDDDIIYSFNNNLITKLNNVYSWASFNNVTYNDCNINAITESRDQGECGSCLIFALISTVEALYEIKKYNEEDEYIPNAITELSEQYILDCLPKYLRVKEINKKIRQLMISKLKIHSDEENFDELNSFACFYKPDFSKLIDVDLTFGYTYIAFYYLLLHNIKFQKRDKYPYEIGVCSEYINLDNLSPICKNRTCPKSTEVDNLQDIYIKDIKYYKYDLEYNISFVIYIDYIKDKIKKGPLILHYNGHATCLIGYGYNNGVLHWIIKNSHRVHPFIKSSNNDILKYQCIPVDGSMRYNEIEIGYNPNNLTFESLKDKISKQEKINKVETMEDLYKLKNQEFVDNVNWQNFGESDEIIQYNISPPPPPPPPQPIRVRVRPRYCATS